MDGFNESAAKEIINFQKLADVAKNANIPLEQRLQAVDELQSQYPAYLGNLSKEDILAGKIGGAYDKIVSALKAKIALQAAEEKLIPIIKEQLIVSDKIAESQKSVAAAAGLTAKDYAASTMNGRNYAKELQAGAIGAAKTIETQSKAYNELEKKIQKVFSSMSALNAAANGLNLGAPRTTKTTEVREKIDNYKSVGDKQQFTVTPEAETLDTIKVKLQYGSEYNDILAQQITNTDLLNEQMEVANQLAAMGGALFQNIFAVMANGGNVGEAIADAFKRIAVQIGAAIAQALIFAALLEAIPGLKGLFATTGAIAQGVQGGGNTSGGGGFNLMGILRGQDMILSNNRTRTSMGLRAGRP
jgi:hypothetical protein